MPHLVNPGGRIVEVSDDNEYTYLLTKGFTIPAESDLQTHLQARYALAESVQPKIETESDVYMITVSQGGKDGYGVASKKLLDEFQKLGTKVSLFNKGQKIGFLFHAPYSISRIEAPVKIIYTMFESDRIPEEWPEYLSMADKVLVPSRWCAEVFAKSGINTEVVPLGYDHNLFKPIERPIKRETREDFYFLHYNAFNIRKGFLEVLKAFVKAFDPSEPVKMIFKTTLKELPLPLPPSQYPNIIIERESITDESLVKLLHKADAFVFPSRGEGFGITPLEAMGTGLPVIVPNAHGISEYFNPEYMYEAKVKETCPGIYARYKGIDVGDMVICDVDQLASQMRYIYEHEKEAKEKGMRAVEYARRYTFEKTARRLSEIFADYKDKEIIDRPLANVLPLEEVS